MLVGPSGGGKTTALKLVNRLIPFDEGDIRIDGRSVRDLPVVELRRGIGYVIQQVGLFPHMTIADNVATVPRLLGWPKARHARARRRAARARRARARTTRRATRRSSRAGSASASGSHGRSRPTRRVLLMDEPFGAARPDHARTAAARAAAPAPRGRQDHDLRHPRHRRGDPDGRPDRDPARGRRARPVRHARRDPRASRRRVRRRSSSARTARCGGSRCAASATSSSTRSARTRAWPPAGRVDAP